MHLNDDRLITRHWIKLDQHRGPQESIMCHDSIGLDEVSRAESLSVVNNVY